LQNNTPSMPQQQDEIEPVNENKTPKDVDGSWKTILSAKGGDSVRSYAWYPLMNSYQPASCAFIASCRDQPIHLIVAYNGSIRATYSPYNALMKWKHRMCYNLHREVIESLHLGSARIGQYISLMLADQDVTVIYYDLEKQGGHRMVKKELFPQLRFRPW